MPHSSRQDEQPGATSRAEPRRRIRARVQGVVQGVGFRPYVHRLATSLKLVGFVLNDARGVVVEVEGAAADLDEFLARLPTGVPPLAAIETIEVRDVPAAGGAGFVIVESDRAGVPAALVAPDVATCSDCLAELFDPADRRFRYPFINCTNCGPRFTIVRGVPYDRPLTTMARFEMCAACRSEYHDPADRRFHAQPNACPECGPSVRLIDPSGRAVQAHAARDALHAAAAALMEGRIVAVKGVGGYHLACRADDASAVETLRRRKHREDRPFAIMAPDLAAAARLIELGKEEADLLAGPVRPIVLARRRADARVAHAVAPAHRDLGIMLPYSPVHHLLLADVGVPLVMTSGNRSDEPIAYLDEDALDRLAGIADLLLVHDRPIHVRADDSVVRVVAIGGVRRPMMLRRSRGYVPLPLDLPVAPRRPTLACGPELKSTFCLARGDRAWMGPHVGDLEDYRTFESFREGIAHLQRLFAVEPEVVAHDLHPDYLSTRYALDERSDLAAIGVQHHHAHLAACLAEHGERGPALGAIYDGTGYGTDGTIWGGELLIGDLSSFERAGHLRPVRMPGGAAAIREPWRMCCAWLMELAGDGAAPPIPSRLRDIVAPDRWRAVASLVRSGSHAPLTSSVGRLFDAVAALCGLRARVTYEGQAAIELEMAVDGDEAAAYPLPREIESTVVQLDPRPTLAAVREDVEAGVPVGVIAARFHNALVEATAGACGAIAADRALDTVVLSGGVFENAILLERTAARLARTGLRVLVPRELPPNDGAIAYGQTAVAAAAARSV